MARDLTDLGRRRQREIYVAGLGGRRPVVPVAWAELEQAARAAMSPDAWAYVAGGAGREATADANRAALDRRRIVPRVLVDVERRDLAVELFGRRLAAPLLLAPVGVLEMVHREADLAAARAAAAWGVPFIFSNQASVPMEACSAAMGAGPRWFQLYWSRSNALVASLVRRAEACGCEAVVLTLDTTMLGWRPRDLDRGSLPFLRGLGIAQYTSDPVFREEVRRAMLESAPPDGARPPLTLGAIAAALEQKARYPGGLWHNLASREPRAAVQRFVATYSRPSLQWEDLAFLRSLTKLPILLKGILHPDDARRALTHGMDGLIVSNHGGRQVDGGVGALDALPGVVAAVQGRVPVLFDSGVRGGADVLKALALGAAAVCLGRPYVYGLAVAGQAGVEAVIANVLAELDLTLGLAGVGAVRGLSPSVLV
ncbi:MAG: alpha-hydroxy-acid oxidizing protein [Opitutaceae bacterium]|nr:alpha-hydroxy-acid oxidizing protein [Opitutaceae bacterium]